MNIQLCLEYNILFSHQPMNYSFKITALFQLCLIWYPLLELTFSGGPSSIRKK